VKKSPYLLVLLLFLSLISVSFLQIDPVKAEGTIYITIAKESELEQPDQINLILAVALICLAIATVLGLLIYLKERK